MIDLRLFRVIRPHIVTGGFLGYLVGTLYALNLGAAFSWLPFLMGYLIVLFMDLSTHFNNDYYDVEVDKHASFKPFGSTNLLIENKGLRQEALYASIASSAFSLVLASTLVLMGYKWHLLPVVILFNALGWMYSAPPVRLHSRRLGEITIAVGTGFCIPAVGYIVAHGGFDAGFLRFSAPLMLYGFILSLCLQVPDYEVDRAMDKKTIVGLIGRRRVYLLVTLCAIAASLTYLMFPIIPKHPLLVAVISLFPALSSLISFIFLSDNPKHARLFTSINIIALFIFLTGLDIILWWAQR
ncbi:MAG: prenyltransferase [Candidatus Bathyarchaeota archaeon]